MLLRLIGSLCLHEAGKQFAVLGNNLNYVVQKKKLKVIGLYRYFGGEGCVCVGMKRGVSGGGWRSPRSA